jgi:hypothetical protein
LILGNGTNSATRLAIGTDGQILTSNGSTAAWGSRLVSGTAVASTSGTSIDFTSIPSWVKRVTVMLNGVSTNGTSNLQIQIGSGSFTTSGYVSGAWSANTSNSNSTTGFLITGINTVAGNCYGNIFICLFSSNTYVESHAIGSPANTNQSVGGGGIALSGVLDRIRITTVGGTNTFDAGFINILYE